jgi:hypothetical protein
MHDRDLIKNGSGYPDPTAYTAIKHMEDEQRRNDPDYEKYMKLIGCILRICELSDFHLEERLVLKDKRTGKVYR